MRHFIFACIIVQHAIFPLGIHALRRGVEHQGKAAVLVDARSIRHHTLEIDVNHSVVVASDNDQGNQSGVEGFGTSSFARDFVGEQGEDSDASSLDSLVEEFNAKHVVNMTTDGERRADEMIKDDVQKSQDVDSAERDRQRLRRIPNFIGSRASSFAPSSFLQTPVLSDLPEEIKVRAKVLRHLNSGTSGNVYELEATCDDYESNHDTTKVALKVMEEGDDDLQMMPQFRIEAKLMERFDSPYVLPLYGPAVEDDTPKMFLMMPLANAGDLFDIVKKNQGTPESRTALWFQTVIGLGYLHRRGVTHMDMKPENVVVTCKGDTGTSKLLMEKKCRAIVADVGIVCESKDWIRFDIQFGDLGGEHICRNTDKMAACLEQLYADVRDNNRYAVYKESDFKEEILSSERLKELKPLNDTSPYFTGDYEQFLKKYYGKVYSKDKLAFRNTNVFFDGEKYPIAIIFYAYPKGCDFRGTPGYISPLTYEAGGPLKPFGHSDADIWSMASMLYVTFTRTNTPWSLSRSWLTKRATLNMMGKEQLETGRKVKFGVRSQSSKLNNAWKAWDERMGGNCPAKRSNDKLNFELGNEVEVQKICQTKGMTFFSPSRADLGEWAPEIAVMSKKVGEVVEGRALRGAPGVFKELMSLMLTDAGSIDLGEIMQMMPQVMEGLSPGEGPKYEEMINLPLDMYTPPKCLSERYLPYPCSEPIKKAGNRLKCGFGMIVPGNWICCRCSILGIQGAASTKHYWQKQVLPVSRTFQPWEFDDIGFEWRADGKVTAVRNVALRANKVVRENWVMTEIDGATYTHELLMQKIEGWQKFAITFSLEQDHDGACIISRSDGH